MHAKNYDKKTKLFAAALFQQTHPFFLKDTMSFQFQICLWCKSKFFLCFFLSSSTFLNVFFMKLFKEEKKFLEREWSADVMYISQDLKIDFVQRLFFLWTWTHIYFGIALLLFTRLLFTLDVVEDIAMVFFVVFIPPLIKSRLFFLHMNVFHIL